MNGRAWLVVLAGAVGCTKAQADGAPPAPVGFDLVAAGDTAKLYLSWTAASGALGAQLTVTVFGTNGVWAALPVASPVTAGGSAVIVTNSATADSATFVACLRSTKGTLVSVGQTCNQRQWKRSLQPPPVVTFDSLIGLRIEPHAPTITTAQTVQFCAFGVFVSGAIAKATDQPPVCDTLYRTTVALTARQRMNPTLQAVYDSVCVRWQATSGTITSAPCPVSLRPGLIWQVAVR